MKASSTLVYFREKPMSQTRATHASDVVVVGGGGSRLAAAMEARSLGRSVIPIEKNPELGGTTGQSVGSNSSSNTPQQLAAGSQDSPQHHLGCAFTSGRLAGRNAANNATSRLASHAS